MELSKTVYLAGPMQGMTGEGMKTWRHHATDRLTGVGMETLDPTRRIPYHQQIHNDRGLETNIAKRVFKQDLRDIARCELLLVNGTDYPGAKGQGTACEIMFSHMKNKIIIIWKDESTLLNPFFTAMATEVHNDLDEAIDALITYNV